MRSVIAIAGAFALGLSAGLLDRPLPTAAPAARCSAAAAAEPSRAATFAPAVVSRSEPEPEPERERARQIGSVSPRPISVATEAGEASDSARRELPAAAGIDELATIARFDPEPQRRERAALRLARSREPEAVDAIAELFLEEGTPVAEDLIRALWSIAASGRDEGRALDVLDALYDHPSPELAALARTALADLERSRPEAPPTLEPGYESAETLAP